MNVDKRKTQVEVLAPAGSLDIMKAVVAAGADAIYLGGNMFGARAFANNFNDEELICAIEYAHLFGRKVYLTVISRFSFLFQTISPPLDLYGLLFSSGKSNCTNQ